MTHLIRNVLVLGVIVLLSLIAGAGPGAAQGAAAAGPGVLGKPVNLALTNMDVRQALICGKSAMYADRKEYWADDEVGQLLIGLIPGQVAQTQPAPAAKLVLETGAQTGDVLGAAAGAKEPGPKPIAAKMVLELASVSAGKAQTLEKVEYANPVFPKFHVAFHPQLLKAGDYQVTAWMEDGSGAKGALAKWDFKRSDKRSDAPSFPGDGLPVTLEPLTDAGALDVPVRLSIPLPRGSVKDVSELAITRDGQDVPSDVKSLVTWGPGASVRWAQARFVAHYKDGQASGYRLVKRKPGAQDSGQGVKVKESDDEITVDNGTLRFTVSKKSFAGIQKAWFDASGKGKYDWNAPVISARGDDSGPFLMDERLVKFTSAADKAPVVKVEEAGPVSVTVLASGWYTDRAARVPALCQYQVRMTLAAGQQEVGIRHNTVITYDTRDHKIRDLGFAINYTGAGRYAFGVDGAGVTGDLPQGGVSQAKRPGEQTVYPAAFMHQKTWELCTVTSPGGKAVDGTKSDGWVATWTDEQPAICVTLKDVWEKFPKELEARSEAIVVHAWPKNGKRVFTADQELALKNIYKYWCFHQHLMLDLNLPQDYYAVLASLDGTETRETKAEHALNGNGQGMTLGMSMSLRVYAAGLKEDEKATGLSAQCLKDARLFELAPYATLSPHWNANSQALEPIASVSEGFKPFEEAIISGLLGYNATVERGQDYGMFIWPDTHTYWLVDQARASLHRTWQNSHYHQVGNSWVLWFRSGDARMLHWARDNSAHFRDVATIAYAEPGSPETAIQFHIPGAMYHCKGCTPWGSETKGMIRHDTHAGIWGHWVDPDAHLYAWLIDGDARAHDMYTLWLSSLKTYSFLPGGVRREANNTLAMTINAYEFTGDADYLAAIWNLGQTLRLNEPLENQNPGPLWHPLWINRYYHLTRDPEYVPFILKYGRDVNLGGTWNLALSALAYEVSGDKSYLTQQLDAIRNFPRSLYRCPGDPYDNYGMGPGPLGMNWGEMGVGSYMRAARSAGITGVPANLPDPVGAFPVGTVGRKLSSEFWGFSKSGGNIAIETIVTGVEGDANSGEVVVKDNDGKTLSSTQARQAYRIVVKADASVAPGSMSNVSFVGYGGISQATKGFDAQAGLLSSGVVYATGGTFFYMDPMGPAGPVTFKFNPVRIDSADRSVVSVIIKDASGKTVLETSMHAMFQNKTAQITLDSQTNPLPWSVDVTGAVRFTMTSQTPTWIIAPTKPDLQTMKPMMMKLPVMDKPQAK